MRRSGFNAISADYYNERVDPVPEGLNESSLARSAWKQDKSRPVPEGRLICLASPRDIFLRMNSVLLCDTTEIRPKALSDLWVQDRNMGL